MEEGEVCEAAKIFRQGPRDVSMVQVNARNNRNIRVIRCRCAVDAAVIADMGPFPVGCEVLWVGQDNMFPCLESYVSLLESGV